MKKGGYLNIDLSKHPLGSSSDIVVPGLADKLVKCKKPVIITGLHGEAFTALGFEEPFGDMIVLERYIYTETSGTYEGERVMYMTINLENDIYAITVVIEEGSDKDKVGLSEF